MKQLNPLHTWWAARPARERRTMLLGGGVVAMALLWGVWLQPSWQQSQRMPAQMAQAQAQWQTVAQLAQQAQGLQAAASATASNALSRTQALALARRLSTQALSIPNPAWQETGDTITVRLGQAPGLTATQLAQWLQAMRLQAQLQPRQLRLQRQPDTGLWQGDITFSGPPLQTP